MRLQLEYVHLIHRHGERTPLLYGPHDSTKWDMCHRASKINYTIPMKNATLLDKIKGFLSYMHIGPAVPLQFEISQNSGKEFNCAPGQLTDKGRENLFSLGRWFKHTYMDKHGLIPATFKKEQFHLRSTNMQRTLESLQSLMQGMYPDHPKSIDVKVLDMSQDTLTINRYCPRLKSLKNTSHEKLKKIFEPKTKEVQKYFADSHSPFFRSLSPYAIYDLVTSSKAHGLKHFNRIPQKIAQALESYSIEVWFNHLNEREALSLNTGGIMKEIADHIVEKQAYPNSPLKVSIFSAHDVTLYPILMAVGVDTKKWPKFGANVIFELFRETGTDERYVQMRYNRKKTEMPRCKSVKTKDGIFCPLDKFIEICNEIYIKNFSDACMRE